ncbi:hypothetical protein [Chitinimonas sp.]|uniref:hypothetical protein n=1 Tax=Chitinimonas sp. TaxID=1934313 RepID=UPI0035B1EB9D
MKKLLGLLLANSLLIGSVHAKSIEEVISEVEKMAAEPVVIQAVKAQNAKKLTLEKIQEIDKAWQAADENTLLPIMKENLEHPASKVLLKLEKASPYLRESILTDNQGANVAITNRTSDYWQGDEPKFTEAWAGGKGKVYLARPKVDESTKEKLSQISVPVRDGTNTIGTLTVGVILSKLQ